MLSELQDYYLSEQWRADHADDIALEYSGDAYSILSEDTIWNAMIDSNEQAKRWIQLGSKALEKR